MKKVYKYDEELKTGTGRAKVKQKWNEKKQILDEVLEYDGAI